MRNAALFVIARNIGANGTPGTHGCVLIDARAATDFSADRRQAGTRRNAAISETLRRTVGIVHANGIPVYRRRLNRARLVEIAYGTTRREG